VHPHLAQKQSKSLLDDLPTVKKLEFNKRRNEEQDHTRMIDIAASRFHYDDCKDEYWNPEEFSLLYGTPLWDQASPAQRTVLNQLYWVAYFSQIVSAEIATIFLNQVAAAGLYTHEDFRIVCDTLDLESRQERSHIDAFKKVSEDVEWRLFGERVFTYPMRSLYQQTMLFSDTNRARDFWRNLQIRFFSLLSSSNAFLASQYLLVRGLRTLNGKLIQHRLSRYYSEHPNQEAAPIPSAISYYHFMDESYHFNTSKIIGHDIPRSLELPTRFEAWIINRGVRGCQQDHFHFSATIKGIFWYEPALFRTLHKMFQSSIFGMDDRDARDMLRKCFTEENDATHSAYELHRIANESYQAYVESINYLSVHNREMRLMAGNSIPAYLQQNINALRNL
jgi:hypothetical protein